MFGKFLVVLLFVIITHQTNYIPLATIDAFQGYTSPLLIILSSHPIFPVSISDYNQNSTILGIERDVALTVESGLANTVYSLGIQSGEYLVATPIGGSAFSLLQYDGVDGSMSLQANGLRNFDATFGGNATAFFIVASTDVSSHLMITLWGPTNSQIASVTVSIPATSSHYEIVIPYSDLAMTNGTLTNVGAIELKVDAPPSVDIVLFYFGIIGE